MKTTPVKKHGKRLADSDSPNNLLLFKQGKKEGCFIFKFTTTGCPVNPLAGQLLKNLKAAEDY